jgi:hypothetical protein
MVRLALLAVLASAWLVAAPAAQAVDLPVDLQGATDAAVGQAQALAGTAGTATNTTPPVTPEVGAAAAAPAVETAPEVTRPAASQPEYTTAAAVSTIADGPRRTEVHPPVRSARFKQGHRDTGSSAAQRGSRAALGRPPADTAAAPTPALDRAPHATGAAPKQPPPAPDRAPATSGGGAASSAPAAGLSLGGGLALLAAAVCLAGPFLRRRLAIEPAALRPVAFVSLLERPG